MEEDGRAAQGPFSFATRADGTVVIRYRAAPVVSLRGRAADRFLTRVDAAAGDPSTLQGLMARATGNFTRGNERSQSVRRPAHPRGT